jgi:SAM-dependent methyltransferase
MSDRWWAYFQDNLDDKHWFEEAVSQFQFMQPLYGMIQRYIPRGGRILDIGSGLGFNDIYLSSIGYRVTGIDNDERIISTAAEFSRKLEIGCDFIHADAFDLSAYYNQYDLVYSLGVLEHFDREITIRLLEEQKKCAEYVLIEIPSKYTSLTGDITDERIYTMQQLRKIVSNAGLDVVTSFGIGDVTVSPAQILLKRLLPYGMYRILQNYGFAFGLAVIGRNCNFKK